MTVKIPSLGSRATFPAAMTATTRALVDVNVSNEAVNAAFVNGEGEDDIGSDDDAPISAVQ